MRKWIICFSVVAIALAGCSIDTKEDSYQDQFTDRYLHLKVKDISNIDAISSLYEEELKQASENENHVVIIARSDVFANHIKDEKNRFGSYEKMYKSIQNGADKVDVKGYFNHQKEQYKDIYNAWKKAKSVVKSYEAYNDLYILADTYYLALLPTDKPYEAFAYLPMGEFNNGPDNETLISVFKHWYEDYGIIPAIITNDSIHIVFSRALKNKEIDVLAEEILLLNAETQINVYKTKADLVKGLKHSKYWEFWWY